MFLLADRPVACVHELLQADRGPSDHVPLSVTLSITDLEFDLSRRSLKPGSDEEKSFTKAVASAILDTGCRPVDTIPHLMELFAELEASIALAWTNCSVVKTKSRRSKPWWTEKCAASLGTYRLDPGVETHRDFRKAVREAKRVFFDDKIEEIAVKKS